MIPPQIAVSMVDVRNAFRIPEQFSDTIFEGVEPTLYRRVVVVKTKGVIMKIRSRRPKADQGSGTIISRTASGRRIRVVHAHGVRPDARIRIIESDRADGRQTLVVFGAEIVPNLSPHRIGTDRPARTGTYESHRDANVGRQ